MEKTLARMNGVLNMENFMSRYSLSLSLSVSLLFGQGLALASTGKPVQKMRPIIRVILYFWHRQNLEV